MQFRAPPNVDTQRVLAVSDPYQDITVRTPLTFLKLDIYPYSDSQLGDEDVSALGGHAQGTEDEISEPEVDHLWAPLHPTTVLQVVRLRQPGGVPISTFRITFAYMRAAVFPSSQTTRRFGHASYWGTTG